MYKNVVLHWTGGNYKPSPIDIEHYHYLIDDFGFVRAGKYQPADNLNCTDGKYAAHCGGGNTGRIGIAICCRKDTNTPPTKAQIDSLCKLSAQLCTVYGLQPNECITHAEFGKAHPKSSSAGKIDINELPYANKKGIKEVADYLRAKITHYYKQMKGN